MKDFILFIKNEGNPVQNLPPEKQQEHIEKVGGFIQQMVEQGVMQAAQPLEIEGSIISFDNGDFNKTPIDQTKEIISGYYHIVAKDLNAAIEIAKNDPRFEDGKWRIEVRPIMKIDGINE